MNYKKFFLSAALCLSLSGLYAAHAPEPVAPEMTRCPFCFENIIAHDPSNIVMHVTAAGPHQAHRECAQPWFAEHDTCPLCREHVNVHALFPGVGLAGGHHAAVHPMDQDFINALLFAYFIDEAQEVLAHPLPDPALALGHCHFCHQALENDPAIVVELPCHHRFHRLCAAHALVDYTAYHRCPVCHAQVDTIYELFPAMRGRTLLRHLRDATLLLSGGIVGAYLARHIVVDSVRASFSSHWGWRNMVGMGIVGVIGLGIAFGLHAEPRNTYLRLADIFTNAVAVSSDIVLVAGGNRDHRVHLITAPHHINFVPDDRIIIPACGLWAFAGLVHMASTLANADTLMPHLPDNMEMAERGRLVSAMFFGTMIPFLLGNACGGLLSAALVGSVRELREVIRILASYWRTRH